jgi:hypothetical protein
MAIQTRLFFQTPLTLPAQLPNPFVRPLPQVRMLTILPRTGRAFKRRDLTPEQELFLGCLGQEAAALPAPDDAVDIFDQLLREDNVCAPRIHNLPPT